MGDEVKWVKVPVVAIVHVTADPVNAMNGLKGLSECACETQRCAHGPVTNESALEATTLDQAVEEVET